MALSIVIPENILLSTRQSHMQFEIEAKRAIALKFYADEKLSLGQAAELANLSKIEFMRLLGENQTSVFRFENGISDLEDDMANAARFANNNVPCL